MKNIRQICTVLLGTGALLLTGCAKDTDLSARYDDFMKYSYGEDYQFEFVDPDGNAINIDNYKLKFHDHSGRLHTEDVWIFPYSEVNDSETELSKKEYYDTQAEAVLITSIGNICKDEMEAKVVQPCFPSYEPDMINTGGDLDGAFMHLVSIPLFSWSEGAKEELSELRERLDPQTGWQVCRADLVSVAQNPEWYVAMTLDIDEGVDPAPFLAQMKEAEQRFLEEVQTPQNFAVFVSRKQNGKTERLYHSFYVFGEKIDAEKRLAENPGYQPLGEAREKQLAKKQS